MVVLCAALAFLSAAPLFAKPGDYAEVGDGDWRDATLMVGMDGALWVIDGGTLYKVSTK